jgi:UDP-N-acetylglucosamine 2-epimerase (non-hydrolysing)
MVVMGTRPEAIKLAPVVLELQRRAPRLDTRVLSTGQHRQMLHQMLRVFGLSSDHDLDIMTHNQGLDRITTAAMAGLYPVLAEERPELVIVQGDTTTTFMGALAAFYHRIPVAHVEAGLRTNDKHNPFPEEINRRLTSQITDLHFAPTELSRQNLLKEGVADGRILVTGNTCIDALFCMLKKRPEAALAAGERRILVTAHRRENHGEPMRRICDAILTLADEFPDVSFTFPVHPSPMVRQVVMPALGNHPRVELTEPLAYDEFIVAMNRAYLILADSGGVQEEAPSLGKPVLVLRETTERPEGLDAGTLKLVGTDRDVICHEVRRLLTDADAYAQVSEARNPYGDGRSAARIADAVETFLATGSARAHEGEPPYGWGR